MTSVAANTDYEVALQADMKFNIKMYQIAKNHFKHQVTKLVLETRETRETTISIGNCPLVFDRFMM